MRPSDLQSESKSEGNLKPEPGEGLLVGITAYELRLLCENTFEGGRGYTPEQVGRMTMDQIYFCLVSKNNLKKRGKMTATETMGTLEKGKDGKYKGLDRDGNPIRAEIRGKSLARELMENEQARKEKERRKAKKRRSRGK